MILVGDLSLHFSEYEFKCKCCGQVKINYNLIYLLEAIREHFQRPIKVDSGYRCEKYNKKVGGEINSQHLLGNAADIIVKNIKPDIVYDYVNSINIKGGLGKYSNFTHVDVCMNPEGRRWDG
jgi:uncharacterized protein YcbK (DUF882 family)